MRKQGRSVVEGTRGGAAGGWTTGPGPLLCAGSAQQRLKLGETCEYPSMGGE